MGILTIAEYVESDQILAKLEEIGVELVQGYYIGKPIPLQNLLSKYNIPQSITDKRPAASD